MAAYIDGIVDAGPTIERLRSEIPEPFAAWREHPFPTRMAGSATLSTFHGCPPDEIGAITKHLMTRHGLDVVVKLNPTLLGFDRVAGIIHDELGFEEVRLSREAFEADLQLPRALGLIDELDAFARDHGRRFGIKLTNTLVVENHRGVLPDDPMYLSGPPLHVISTTLLGELHRALPGRLAVAGQDGTVEVSFSAGVTKGNLPAMAGLGVAPITVCSDLLRPGGYGRLRAMLTSLTRGHERGRLRRSRRVAGASPRRGGGRGPSRPGRGLRRRAPRSRPQRRLREGRGRQTDPPRGPRPRALGLRGLQRLRHGLPQRRLLPAPRRPRGWTSPATSSTSSSRSSATSAGTARSSAPRRATPPVSSRRSSSIVTASRSGIARASCYRATPAASG